jgi:glycosyltransferase involved in cell wall biosynthesis
VKSSPELSLIVPAYNAEETLAQCLDYIFAQAGDDVEVIVVDDGSTDSTREIAARYPAKLIVLPENLGAAAARNRGVESACGQVLFFLDADVALCEGALMRGRAAIEEPGVDAVIGSYDDEPAARTVVSQFKNLAHHYFHQCAGPEVNTFWGACGLIKRAKLLSLGGFDESYRQLEDVELGYRLANRGARIRLDRHLQVKHLKHWTLPLMVKTDVMWRGIPWAALWLEHGYLTKGLNFEGGQRLAAILALAMSATALVAIFRPLAIVPLVLMLGAAAWINRGLYMLFLRQGGTRLMVGGFLLQQLYYLYSLMALIAGVVWYYSKRLGLRSRPLR